MSPCCLRGGVEKVHQSFILLQTIKDVDLQALESLEYINLSRNLIREIMPGTFLGMPNLKGLDFSVNAVIKVRILLMTSKNCHLQKLIHSF